MRNINPIAWEMLTEHEKQAIILQHGHDKSSWEAGEILGRSHYKYLEIKYRAEQFLKLFTFHIHTFEDVVPEGVSGKDEIKEYFQLLIRTRITVKAAYEILDQKYGSQPRKGRELDIVEQMGKWQKSENAYDRSLYDLIKEFDRWNNFRVLPREIQEPSAFNRRVKNVHKKHLKTLSKFPEISVGFVKKNFAWKSGKAMYLPIITDQRKVHVLKIRNSAPVIKVITNLDLYLFAKEGDAIEYINLAKSYLDKDRVSRKCRDGLEFWPKYRELMKKALNYEPIQKIVPSRKYLQQALQKLKFL